MPAFVVTTATNEVPLDATTRRGSIPITVSNISGRPLRVRLNLVPTPPAEPAWLSVEGEAEREFANGASGQFTAVIAVPAAATAGTYTFKPVAAAEDRPMEEFTEGPTLLVKVGPSSEKKAFPWWIVAVGAAVLLLAVLLVVLIGGGDDEPTPVSTTAVPIATTTTQPGPPVKSQGTASIAIAFDLDRGLQVSNADTRADASWQKFPNRQLVPFYGAQISRLGAVDFDTVTLNQLQNAVYTLNAISGGPTNDQLAIGTVFAVRTNEGDFAKVRVENRFTSGQDIEVRWVTFDVP